MILSLVISSVGHNAPFACYLLFFNLSSDHFLLGSHLEPYLCLVINNSLLKINCISPGPAIVYGSKKQFDTRHGGEQIAITRLADL